MRGRAGMLLLRVKRSPLLRSTRSPLLRVIPSGARDRVADALGPRPFEDGMSGHRASPACPGRSLAALGMTVWAALVVLVASCASEPAFTGPLRLETTRAGAATRLTLIPAS